MQETDESVDSLMTISDFCTIILFANNCFKDCKKTVHVLPSEKLQVDTTTTTKTKLYIHMAKAMEVLINNKKLSRAYISTWGDKSFFE